MPSGWCPLERPYWQSSEQDVDAALAELVEWAVSLPGRGAVAAVSSTVGTFVPVPLSDAYAFMHRTQQRFTFEMVNTLVVTSGNDFRSVDLRQRGGLIAASEGVRGGKTLDWLAAASHMRELLAAAGEWCAYGHLVRDVGTSSTSTLSPDGDHQIGNPWASRKENWAELVTGGGFFDAYAVMRLPAATRQQVAAQWNVVDLSASCILAEHPDQAAWLAQPRTDPATLDTARRSLGEALIDRSQERVRG